MRLAKPFYRLPIQFDVERLRAELASLPESAWARHPNEIKGNSSIRLISVNGGENDEVNGPMAPTPHLLQSPYLRQVLASFGVVWSRSRLLRLAPNHGVPPHADINYHWFYRVRLHIPIITDPAVRFICDGESVHMAEGEAWVFDNWRLHRVENSVDAPRVHLVADTAGSAAFWRFVGSGERGEVARQQHRFDPARQASPLTETQTLRSVMPPAEVDLLVLDLRSELAALDGSAAAVQPLAQYHSLVDGFRRDWRQLYSLFGENPAGWPEYAQLRDSAREASRGAGEGLFMRTNRVAAHTVFEARVLRVVLSLPEEKAVSASGAADAAAKPSPKLERPVFIIAAPRSGSTLLFETLAASHNLCTLGGEAHWLVEGIETLRPGAPQVESNRLGAEHATESIAASILERIAEHWVDCAGHPVEAGSGLRFLEKTPKNALRIPFLRKLFPDANFIFLWRDPRESLGSIIDAWASGQWKTYNGLPGFEGPWSLLLPPGWQAMNGRPREDIAAFQWESANRIVLEDLATLPRDCWTALSYEQLLADPLAAIERLCGFMNIDIDAGLAARLRAPLPLSHFTNTPPDPDKWRRHEREIQRVLPQLQTTWRRLQDLD